MSTQKLSLLLLMGLMACEDKPYNRPQEQGSAEALVSEPGVVAPRPASYNFIGTVELGVPVSGAIVSAYKFPGPDREEKIKDTLSNPDGTFELGVETDYNGPILLTARGGTYKDLATGEMIAIRPEQELSSAITHIEMLEKTNINAWTTLAVARVLAKQGFWDKSVSDLKHEDRINVDFSHISYFLTGKSDQAVNIRRQGWFDGEKESFKLNDPRVTLYLTHAGLSQLAKSYSDKLVNEGRIVTVVDLISALELDLSDRVFDGKKSDGSIIFIGNNRQLNLTSYTMRKDLAEAIYHYSKQLNDIGRLTNDDLLELRSPGKLIDSLAKDARPELFLDSERPLPIDIRVPEMQISFTGKHKNERPFAALDGDVFFNVNAKDDSNVAKITLIAPGLEKLADENTFGPLSIHHQQNVMEIAILCDNREEFESKLKMGQFKREDVFCACFEVMDEAGNKERELSCFQREKPTASILSPANRSMLARADLQHGIKIEAVVESGVAMANCFWSIYGGHSEIPKLKGEGKIVGTKCVVGENLNKDLLRSGDYILAIQAKDMAGRAPTSGNTVDFQVRHDLVRLPDRIVGPRS